jgi:hypothetical protein
MKSNGKRVKKSDGVIPKPIHPLGSSHPLCTSHPILGCSLLRGGGKLKEGHTKKTQIGFPVGDTYAHLTSDG